jgi:2-aminoadipate transaminase
MDRSIGGSHGGRRGRETAHELARYEALFAARTRGMKSSAMREMMALTERPDVISLAGGLPDTSTFVPELYAKLMSQVAAESTARALQYGPTEGMAVAVDCIVEVMTAEGTSIDPANVIVTTGGQQVIDLVCKALIDPGDVIVAEAPTYPGAVPTFGAYQADVVQIEIDSDGMPIDELEAVLDRLAAEGRQPKFIYTIPNFQNPGGVTMSLPRRRRLVEVARERELLVLEDNPYGLLRYEGEALPTLYSLDAQDGSAPGGGSEGGVSSDLVIYLGTFSKILSPGLRLGWAVAPNAVLEKLNLGKQGADLCSSPMTQLFVSAYFAERAADGRPAWIEYVERLRDLYRRRRDVMLESLAEHFGGRASWTRPEGGLFIWATLDGVDTTDLMGRSKGVAFVPGRSAYMDVEGRSGANSMRLNFAGVPDVDIREGIRRISAIAGPDTGLMGALTGSSSARAPSGGTGAAERPPAGGEAGAGAVVEAGSGPGGETPSGTAGSSGAGGETPHAGTDSRAGQGSRGGDERDPGLADVVELPRREVSDPAHPSPSRRRQDR